MHFKDKRITSLFLALALVLGMFLPPIQSRVLAEKTEVKEIVILHTNDVHGNVAEAKYNTMGMAKMLTKINEIRGENPNTILLDGGDAIHGQPISTLSRGESIIRLMNTMGYDGMVAGNHDFDYGYNRLLELKEIAEFPILGGNVEKEDGIKDLVDFIIKDVDGVKIGIFGLSTPETLFKTKPSNVEGIIFNDPVETAKNMVEKLEEEEVDIIIGLTHLGLEGEYTSIKVAEEVEGIDLIVDGHSHSKLDEGKKVGDTLIVQTHEKGNNLGIVNIEFANGQIINKEASLFLKSEGSELEEDPVLKELIDTIEEENRPEMEKVLGSSKVYLDGERETTRTGETNLGNLLTDMMLEASGADLVMTNGGGIRASIEVGEITKEDVLDAFSFDNIISVIEVSGGEIKAALEHGISDYPEAKGAFPHVAGMTYKFDSSKPAGNRVTEIIIKDQPVDLEKTYELATNDFMATGGDGYDMFKDKVVISEFDALNQLLMDYIEELGEIDIETQGRIIEELVGQPEPEPKPEIKEEVYVIKGGDVLYRIGIKFNTSWQKIAKHNKIKNPNLIFPGQKIIIPIK